MGRLSLTMLLMGVLVAGSGAAARSRHSTRAGRSGIRGEARLGPVHPVSRPGEENSRPYAEAEALVLREPGGKQVAHLHANGAGRFELVLPAGRYRLVPVTPSHKPLPRGNPRSVNVRAGRFTVVTLDYDSGIR